MQRLNVSEAHGHAMDIDVGQEARRGPPPVRGGSPEEDNGGMVGGSANQAQLAADFLHGSVLGISGFDERLPRECLE